MKISKNIILVLLTFTICFWVFFSSTGVSTFLVLGISFVLLVTAIICAGGKVIIKGFHVLLISNWAIMFLYTSKFTPGVVAYNLLFVMFCIAIMVFTSKQGVFDEGRILKIVLGFSFLGCAVVLAERLLGERMSPLLSLLLSGNALTEELNALHLGHLYSGFASGVNVVSFATLIVLAYAFYLLKPKSALQITIIILGLLVVLFTGERSNPLLIPLSIMIAYCFLLKKGKLLRGFQIMFGLLLLIGVFAMISPLLVKYQAVNRIAQSIEMFINGNDIMNGRTSTYNQAISLWKESPVFGHGWLYFYNNHYGILKKETFSHVHNMLLELLCDCGIVGTLMILAPRVYLFVLNIKALGNATVETKGKFAFTLAVQSFFYLDSMVHVTFYSIYIAAVYYLIILYFIMLRKRCAVQEYSKKMEDDRGILRGDDSGILRIS